MADLVTPLFDDLVSALPGQIAASTELPPAEAEPALRAFLREQVAGEVVRAAAEGAPLPVTDLEALARAIRDHLPEGVESTLGPRVGILLRLLREGALDPAWTLARDNASGVVRPERATSMWAGGSNLSSGLPLPTRVDPDGRVFAWLPGFRDPRWSVPDEVYDIGHWVVLRAELDQATIDGDGVLRMRGSGFLGQLRAEPDDVVTVRLTGPGGQRHAVRATRLRRPDLVASRGPELHRLAWGGWRVAVPVTDFPEGPGTWRIELEITQGPVERVGPLGARRGPLATPRLTSAAHETWSWRYELGTGKGKGLQVVVTPVTGLARRLPPAVRGEARRLRRRVAR